jgi:hypothetical protein
MAGQRVQSFLEAAQAQPVIRFAGDYHIHLAHCADTGGSAQLHGYF